MCGICRDLLAGVVTDAPAPVIRRPQLAEREIEVIVAWLIHETKQAAARELYIELSTVKTVIQRARQKYQAVGRPASTQLGLLVRLLQDGVIDISVLLSLNPDPQRG